MAVTVKTLKPSPNHAILNAIRNQASHSYQQRIPEATKANIQDTLRNLQNNRPLWNEFVDALINRIGLVILQSKSWTNPLAEFKRGMLNGGDTIEEIMVGLVESKVYDPDREYLEKEIFGTERPEVQVNFHRINRQEYYKVTVNHTLLERAFLNEQGGLQNFINEFIESPSRSDQLDEFNVTCSLFREYEENGGFFKINVPNVAAIDSDASMARAALRRLKETGDNLKFLSTHYNAAHMPTFATEGELVLFTTPEFKAAVDVEALAAAFNMDKLNVQYRIVTIPKKDFGIEGCQAILTTKDFFVIADTHFSAEEIRNPVALHSNYFLHHHQIISASRFVPAVMFTTGVGTVIEEDNELVDGITAITVKDRDDVVVTDVERGEIYQLIGEATTIPADGRLVGVRWSVSGNTDPRTYVTPTGVLHVGPVEGDGPLALKGTTVWIDGDALTHDAHSAETSVTVSGIKADIWPDLAPEPEPIP